MRGFSDVEEARRFLNPSLDQLNDPFKLKDMDRAVARLEQALARKERIAIHGDYDVDGITSTVILRRALELLGGTVVHFIPERIKDGYGLQPAAIDASTPTGWRGRLGRLRHPRHRGRARVHASSGSISIITDHHEPDTELPPALAVINPKRHDCTYPDKHLAGVGVALKLVQALCERAGKGKWLPAFVKIAAVGTLADVVPLVGENRVIARLGLASLSTGPHTIGLRALLEATGLAGKTIDSYQVAFMIAPRVNAAGRMSTPDIATRLLLATDESMGEEARALAQQLNDENLRRQQEEAELVVPGEEGDRDRPGRRRAQRPRRRGDGWHRGVIGIAASKLVDAYHKPAIVLSIDGDVAHGSCRSIPDFDMLGALEHCADLFVRFGGHRQAAGLTMEAARVPEFRARVNAYADDVLEPDQLRPRLRIDGPLHLKASPTTWYAASTRWARSAWPTHARSSMPARRDRRRPALHQGPPPEDDVQPGGPALPRNGVARRRARRLPREHRAGVNLAFSLDRNEYQGETYLELTVADFKSLDGVE